MARKCTEYHYFQHTYWDAMARYNWTRCPHCGKLCKPSRFKAATVLVPIEFVIFVVCIFFRNSMNDAIGWFAAWLLFVLLLFLPHYIYVRFFMPYGSSVICKNIDNMGGRLGSDSGQPLFGAPNR